MSGYLGLDTSNYTTSAAYLAVGEDKPVQAKQLLPVKAGEMGLRQSDAVFHHTRQLPEILERLAQPLTGGVVAVAASDRPQQKDGSYMPCFLVGAGAARQLGAVLGVPVYFFTHQQGHVMAALTGAECLSLREQPFLAFHVSGGTTDALLVEPDETCVIRCRVVGHSLDLKAGQLIDRVGGLLGLTFPAGPALEQLALQAQGVYKPKATLRGTDCHLSGVENQCRDRLAKGEPPAEIARFCLDSVGAAVEGMTEALLRQYGDLPVVYVGGVMSNSLLKQRFTDRFGGRFAPPAYSADNAAGIACLCRLAHERG
ncbi:MAG: peptidase M22 [Ruminococcaceae bacterium]|nr:peptidase M22 [Oscillospiraceae bacterium]